MVLTVRCSRELQVTQTQTEPGPLTTSFNLVQKIREKCFRWLDHIIRAGPGSIMYQTLVVPVVKHSMEHTINLLILMDTPRHNSIDDIKSVTNDRGKWKVLSQKLQ